MFNRFKKQVNVVIRDRVIRYMVSSQPAVEGVTDFGEKVLEPGIIEEGKVIDAAAFQSMVTELATEKDWKGNPLYFCVPDSTVAIREHFIPKELALEEIKSYIQMELDETIRLPFADPVFDFVVTGEEKGQRKILLFACPQNRITSYKNAFEKAGLKPMAADLASLSVYRMYEQLEKANETDHLLLIQWNMDAIILTAFHQKRPLFSRYIKMPVEAKEINWEANSQPPWTGTDQEIDESIEDQLVTIDRFMDFYQYSVMNGTEEINKVLLTGDFPFLARTEEHLRLRYNVEIETLKMMETEFDFQPKYMEVLGLAMKKL